MKTVLCSVLALFVAIFTISAQEETDVKKETVTKTVVVKDGRIHTKVTDQVNEEKEVIRVQSTDELNQGRNATTQNQTTTKVVKDEVKADKENDAMLDAYKKNEEMEVKKSKRAVETNNGRTQKADVQSIDDPNKGSKIVKKEKKVIKKIDN